MVALVVTVQLKCIFIDENGKKRRSSKTKQGPYYYIQYLLTRANTLLFETTSKYYSVTKKEQLPPIQCKSKKMQIATSHTVIS